MTLDIWVLTDAEEARKAFRAGLNNLAYGGTAPSPVWPGPSVWASVAGVQARQINCSQTEKALL